MAPDKPTTSKKAKTIPSVVADFTILPLTLQPLPGLPDQYQDAKHYIYVKPHEPSIPTADDERSLFIANIPLDATESNVRALFADQLGGSMVERVDFDAPIPAQPLHKRWKSDNPKPAPRSKDAEAEKRGKKRKRSLAEDEAMVAEGVVEDEESALPRLWDSEVRRSGSGAVVVFVDKRSAKGALKEVSKAIKEGRSIAWKSGEGLGIERYRSHNRLVHPSHTLLQSSINAYLTQFTALETLRNKTRKTARSVPDEDGFITVTRGGRAGPARLEDAEKKKAEQDERRKTNAVKDDFYRFQNREKRKEAEGLLKRRFEEDRRRVESMRERRGRVRPEV
ncbi:ribosomal RNA-processing protein 7-domain-containing protein [Pyrenochaeta sp. MPI-SDFR-AT-0127]|nr:ribosomal RNA-processing protein 7-domain-containing protein [Pyrenochaeta sp. MPI-SDFR-AT-0127]